MMRSARLWILMAGLPGLYSCNVPTNGETPARREAKRLYLEGLDQILQLNYGAASGKLRDALMTDPGYLPPLADLWQEVSYSHATAAALDTVIARATDPGVARCLRRAVAAYRGRTAPVPPATVRESPDARHCTFYVYHHLESPSVTSPDSSLALALLYRESPSLNAEASTVIASSKDRKTIEAMARQSRQLPHGLSRIVAYTDLANALHEVGADSLAIDLEQAAARDANWALPGFRAAWAARVANHVSLRALTTRADPASLQQHVDSVVAVSARMREDVMAFGDTRARLFIQASMGVEALDRGELGTAVRRLSASIALVDSVGDPGLRAYVYMRYGRALVKAGRAPDAERILLTARSLGVAAGLPRVQKEVEHNLLHLYESLGRDSAALHAGEAFVRFASMGALDPVRMMSARDLGMFLRARGRVAESRRYFARMLADIDTLGHGSVYAGEYHELTGAVDDALAAYTAAAHRTEDAVRALAGLVRLALSMGDTAAARRWATIHDRRRDAPGRPEAQPLLPSVLRRTVGGAPARVAFEQARAEVARHQQVSAWASLTLDLAALEYDLGDVARASSLADSAAEAATRVGAHDTVFRARALRAASTARHGTSAERESAIAALQAMATDTDRRGGVLIRSEMRRMIAGVFAAHGRWRDALAQYQRAVSPLDSVAGQIAMDPGQASFRSAQRQSYDEALRIIVQNSTAPQAVHAFATWSVQRKGRTYVVRLPTLTTAGALPRPDAGTAIVDYVMLDSLVAALVVTAGQATIVPLGNHAAQVRADVIALRNQVDVRVGSSLDATRAHFPLPVAHRLYRALLQPLESLLQGTHTLVIVPDGILSLVPFEALVVSMPARATDAAAARFVLDDRTVVNATTMQADRSAWRVSPRSLTIIEPGNVPDATREVEAIMATLPEGAVTALRGHHATRDRATREMTRPSIVHFIAHAEANEHDPGSSRVALAPGERDDGALGASEITALRLDGPLVFLSACETANGRVLDGEGVLSLSRSFLRAGARATVATLWPVGRGAVEFSQAFYANIVRTGDAALALRAAKLSLRRNGIPPTAWAAYQLSAAPAGRPDPPSILARRH